MKKLITLAFLVIASFAFAQTSTLTAQSAKAFAKATTSEDTSATLTIGAYPYVWLHCNSVGTDSAVIYQNIDAYINGVWTNNILRDTLTLGRPAGYTQATTKGQIKYRQLRGPSITDLIGGALYIRIRSKHAAGAGDSTSATSYTQKVILSKY